MRPTFAAVLLLGMAALPLRAADSDAARAVIERAVKAHGGADAMRHVQTAQRRATGTIASFGKDVPFNDDMLWQLPGRFRLTLDLGAGQDKSRVVVVVTPERGWQTTGGMVTDLGPDRLDELHEEAYVLWLFTLTPLLKEPGFGLTSLPEGQVNGRAVDGVKVTHKGHGDAQLYFDKDSSLLIKIERRAREAGRAVQKQYLYADHKDFDGARLPTRQAEVIDGKPFSELKDVRYKLLRGVNEAAFSKP